MDYRVLTPDNMRARALERVGGLEAEHFDSDMVLKGLANQADSETKAQAVAELETRLRNIEAAHQSAVAELDALPAPEGPPTP